MTHPQDTPANPAQGVSEALSDCLDMLARFTHSTSNDLNHVEARAVYRAGREALVAAIGAGGQAVAVDRQRIDDALVSCAGLLRTLCKDEIGDTAAAELEYVRSIISNPPAQPGWQDMSSAPKDGTEFAAVRRHATGRVDLQTYRWEGAPNYWNSVDGCTCIRPDYQDKYLWSELPAAPLPGGA